MKNELNAELLHKIMKEFNSTTFCSEADFQFSLAWKIKEKLKDAEVILECPIKMDNQNIYVDICVDNNQKKHYIELKYKTVAGQFQRNDKDKDREITLKDQAAQNNGRYDFCLDIQRLENIAENDNNYAILLTNDHNYWDPNLPKNGSCGYKFSINKGITSLKGELNWDCKGITEEEKRKKYKSRKDSIKLDGDYNCSDCWIEHNKKFQYLMLEIKPIIKKG